MKGFLRRLRGVIGTALTWAIGWGAVSAVLLAISGFSLGAIGVLALGGMFTGFIAGSTFAVILSIAERRHTLEDLSLRRVALWGGIGGIALSLLLAPLFATSGAPLGQILLGFVIDSLTGAGFAAGSVALAKRADTQLIEGDDETVLRLEGD